MNRLKPHLQAMCYGLALEGLIGGIIACYNCWPTTTMVIFFSIIALFFAWCFGLVIREIIHTIFEDDSNAPGDPRE